jgi:hypothetical protein
MLPLYLSSFTPEAIIHILAPGGFLLGQSTSLFCFFHLKIKNPSYICQPQSNST